MKAWSAVFTALLGVLVWRNRFLFWTPIHELGDSGANSIAINHAKHFELLVGNYSRIGFNHPGPGYLYIEAFGEWLFHDLLGIVPTPWNGQLLAIFLLNAATLATVYLVIRRWIPAAFALVAMMLFIVAQPPILTSSWMPFLYVPTFLLLLVSTASVVAGRPRDLWLVALSGGLLIHGHVVFVLFASALILIAIGFVLFRRSGDKYVWLPAIGILLLFAAPIVLNTLLSWPGEVGKYLAYGVSDSAGSRSVPRSIAYVARYWWPTAGSLWWLVLPVAALAVYLAARIREPFVRAGLWLGLVITVLLLYYAYAGIDNLGDPYMGYFYWSVPLFVLAALASRWRDFRHEVAVACVVAIGLIAPGMRTATHDDYPEVPATLATLSNHAGGRPIVVETSDELGLEVPGLVQWAHRKGIRACVRDEKWVFLVSREFVCTPNEAANGLTVARRVVRPNDPAHDRELARIGKTAFYLP